MFSMGDELGKRPLTRRRMAATLSPGRGQDFFWARRPRAETPSLSLGERVPEGRGRVRGYLHSQGVGRICNLIIRKP